MPNYNGLTRNQWPGTFSPSSNHPIVLDTEIRGGLRYVSGDSGDKVTDITGQRLQDGMIVYVENQHTAGTKTFEAAILAVWNGACIIEKHLTYDNKAKGPDHEASLNPKQFTKFVEVLRNTEILKTVKIKNKEEGNKKFVRKFLVAKKKY